MSHSIHVSPATIRCKADELKQMNCKYKKEIETLRSREASLNGMWEGEAKNTFHRGFARDLVQMQNFYNAIEKYIHTLYQIAKEYEHAERRNICAARTRSC